MVFARVRKVSACERRETSPARAGGGSVQEAFAMTPEEAKTAPDASYVTQLKGGGREYSVYVYRCGLLGSMEEDE